MIVILMVVMMMNMTDEGDRVDDVMYVVIRRAFDQDSWLCVPVSVTGIY